MKPINLPPSLSTGRVTIVPLLLCNLWEKKFPKILGGLKSLLIGKGGNFTLRFIKVFYGILSALALKQGLTIRLGQNMTWITQPSFQAHKKSIKTQSGQSRVIYNHL